MPHRQKGEGRLALLGREHGVEGCDGDVELLAGRFPGCESRLDLMAREVNGSADERVGMSLGVHEYLHGEGDAGDAR